MICMQRRVIISKYGRRKARNWPEYYRLGMKCTRNYSLRGRSQSTGGCQTIGEEFRYGLARRLPCLLSEKKLDFGSCDKIFTSDWLSEDQVVVGTKCNKVNGQVIGGVAEITPPLRLLSFSLLTSTVTGEWRFLAWVHHLCLSLLGQHVGFTVCAAVPAMSGWLLAGQTPIT